MEGVREESLYPSLSSALTSGRVRKVAHTLGQFSDVDAHEIMFREGQRLVQDHTVS